MVKLSVDQAMLRAKSHVSKGEIAQAKVLYKTVLAAFPNNQRAKQAFEKLNKPIQEVIRHPPQAQLDALIALYNQGKLVQAVEQAEPLTEDYPTSFLLLNILGATKNALGLIVEAQQALWRAVEIQPDFAAAHNNLGNALKDQGKLDEAIASYENALKIKPDYAEAYNNIGNALKDQGKLDKAIASYENALKIKPDYAKAYNNMGNALQGQGKLDEAITSYENALKIKHDYAETYNNMGTALKDQGKLDGAITSYENALKIKPDYADAYNNLGVALKDQRKLDEAIASYENALKIKPDYADAYNNMGSALQGQGKLDEAIASYETALKIKPVYAEPSYNMGNALQGQGKLDEAISSYQKALKSKPDYAEAYNNMGVALKDQRKLDEAIASYQKALKIKPDYADAQTHMLHQLQHICDFEQTTALSDFSATLGIDTKAVPPFAALSWADNLDQQLARSRNWAREKYRQATLQLPAQPQSRPVRLKIGYFSADFHDHPLLRLISGLMREHDKHRFEIFAFSYSENKDCDLRQQLIKDVEHFVDVYDYSDSKIADLARSSDLDIAIDLTGYTRHSRSRLFQFRLAPIQINYLGFPGSMGADFIDYIVADPVVIPRHQRPFYSEKAIYLPNSYLPNDDAREIAQTITTRADFGLPEDAFVFCCFNKSYKISRREFDIWMRVLNKVEGSVLWLFNANKWVEPNLRKEAEKRGIDPLRLIFADRVSQSEHLARHKHADLFIDTFNYNAHTTASDALWSGLPVVTKQGNQFAARVAASLLTAIGLLELITTTEEDYEALILELATNREKLAEVKKTLDTNRLTQPLFDTKRYARDFEAGLTAAYDLYFADQEPRDIWVRTS